MWDDQIIVEDNEAYRTFDMGKMLFSLANRAEYLPVRDFSYAVDYLLWGKNPLGFHLANNLIYFMGTVFLYLMTLRISTVLLSPCRSSLQRPWH